MKQKMAGLILAAVLASVLLSGCGSGTEQTSTESGDSYQEIELVMAVNGTDIQIDTKVAKKFAELVEEESGGRVTVAVFPNDQLAGGNSTKGIEMIAVGGADLAAYATSVMSVLDGQMSIATIPWSFDNYTEARTVIDETGGDYYAKVLEEKGITYLGSFHNGFRQISNSRHEVRTPEDVQGLKIRVPGSEVYMDFFRELKADPISMSWSEVFTAIQQGAIDGQENGVSITDSAKMYEVQDYMTLWNYTCIHRDAVSGRYPSGASHGSGADGDCASGGKQKRTGDTAQSIRKRTLDGIPGCILGPADAGHYSGRDLRRNLYAYGSGGSVRHLGLFVGIFIYRQIRFRELYTLLLDSVSTTATVMFITAAASLFAYVLTRARLDVAISTALQQVTGGSTMIFFIIVNIILLIAGCFLDSTSALYIFTPLFVPVANALGIDLVHLGVVMIVNLAIGLFTPPVGVNLYVACGVADVNLKDISKAVIPLLIASILVLLIVTYVPAVSLAFV